MASPTLHSHQKRASKAIIPAVPILPGQNPAKQEAQAIVSSEAPAQSPAGPTKLDYVSAESRVVPRDPFSSALIQSSAQDEPTLVRTATEMSNSNEAAIAQHEIPAEEPEAGHRVTLGEAELSAAELSNLAQPQNELPMDVNLSTDMPMAQAELHFQRPTESTTSSADPTAAPFVVDSSVARQKQPSLKIPNGNIDPNASNISGNASYSFHAPAESSEVSPVQGTSAGSGPDSLDLVSPVEPQVYPNPESESQFHWQFKQDDLPLPLNTSIPLVSAVSTFSPAAAVFTPATSTPPYSHSPTPALAGASGMPMIESGARKGIVTPGHPTGNGFVPAFDQISRRRARSRGMISHAHGEQRHPQDPQQYDPNSGYSRSRASSTGVEGLYAPLVTHLTSLYDSGSLSDWNILVTNHENAFQPVCLAVHGAVISRNPVLWNYMQAAPHKKKELTVQWSDTYIHPSSFNWAVRYLYNEVLPSKEEVERMSYPGEQGPSHRHLQLHWALSYFLSGCMLNLRPVIKHGRSLVRAFIDWDILETAMHWAIDYRPKTYHEPSDSVSSAMSRTTSSHSNTSDITSSSRSKVAMPNVETFRLKTLANGNPLMISQPASDVLLEHIVYFLASRIHFESFVLDATVRATEMKSRLPVTKEIANHARPMQRPGLRGISFGDFPVGPPINVRDPAYQNHVASFAILNLPFDQIKGLLNLLQRRNDPRAFEFAKQVIADRENARNRVLRSKSANFQERENNFLEWYDVGWQEFISDTGLPPHINQIDGHSVTASWRLDRVWVGTHNPASNASKNKHYNQKHDQPSSRTTPEQLEARFSNSQVLNEDTVSLSNTSS